MRYAYHDLRTTDVISLRFFCFRVRVDLGYDMTWVRIDRGYELTWYELTLGTS